MAPVDQVIKLSRLAALMASTRRPLADLLRDAAEQLENSPRIANNPSSPPGPHNITPRHPVDAEVSRLFGRYNGGRTTTRRRTVAAPAQVHSYTHSFCCIKNKNASIVPNRYAKDRLAAAGLGEKRLTFQGTPTNPDDFREFVDLNLLICCDHYQEELFFSRGNKIILFPPLHIAFWRVISLLLLAE